MNNIILIISGIAVVVDALKAFQSAREQDLCKTIFWTGLLVTVVISLK